MGTTLTAILFAGGRLALCHVGDSRAYLVRDGQLSQITHDDTFVQTLIDDGRITAEEANSHPQRSLLLRALNGQEVEPDLSMREARAGDRYLLCSDGLSGVVSEETLAEALKDPDPQSTADRLIELALRSGGPDNITVIVADVVEDAGGRGRLDPVIDGAAGDNVGQRAVDPRSAAGRAALADPRPEPPAPAAPVAFAPPRRRRRRGGAGPPSAGPRRRRSGRTPPVRRARGPASEPASPARRRRSPPSRGRGAPGRRSPGRPARRRPPRPAGAPGAAAPRPAGPAAPGAPAPA
jgi:protein phosphatase